MDLEPAAALPPSPQLFDFRAFPTTSFYLLKGTPLDCRVVASSS